MSKLANAFVVAALAVGFALSPALASITTARLEIQGVRLELTTGTVTTDLNVPVSVGTRYPGDTPGLTVVGELTGPGLETPIPLTTAPGHAFQIPGLPIAGIYTLQNVRLMNGQTFLQYATPAAATIIVAKLLDPKVSVRQLSPDEIRARGIPIDPSSFDVYEFSFTLLVDGKEVKIPFPVVVDPRTHQIQPIATEQPYTLPPPGLIEPPRWTPPTVVPFEWPEEAELPEPGKDPVEKRSGGAVRMPAAIVMPGNLAALHQFFAVSLVVNNGAPEQSPARLEDIRATLRIPTALRTAKTIPQVTFGQPVPLVDENGNTFLVAQGRGEAEWTLEGLAPGTHSIEFDLRAVLRQPGQPDIPLRAQPSAVVVIHDPRFQINFSHPATVRAGSEYSTWTFLTNLDSTDQTLALTSDIPSCAVNASANVCRLDAGGSPASDLITIPAGEMRAFEYRLRANVTGQVFATAGSVSGENLDTSVALTMGVSATGIPLSPATLVLPHYAQYLPSSVISENLQLLGLGYSLATAPLTARTAGLPQVITTDVFQRGLDLARAGQRIFITADDPAGRRDALSHLALDLAGNGGYALREWDALRRLERSGRTAAQTIVDELSKAAFAVSGTTTSSLVDAFAAATAYRAPFAMALAHCDDGMLPPQLTMQSRTGGSTSSGADPGGQWTRELPWVEISSFSGGSEKGQLALAGRWVEDLDLIVTPSADGRFEIELLVPDTRDARLVRAHLELTGSAGVPLTIALVRGAQTIEARQPDGGLAAVATISYVDPGPVTAVAARQDLDLDPDGHKVSVLFNRPVAAGAGVDLATRFSGDVFLDTPDIHYTGMRAVSAAALQEDQRTINLTFDHTLSTNARYQISIDDLVDPLTGATASFGTGLTPKVDNHSPAGIVYGKVLKGDNTPLEGVDVVLRQYVPNDTGADPRGARQFDVSQSDGAFLFEFVRREISVGWTGAYRLEGFSSVHGHAQLEGAVRTPGAVHRANLQFLGRGAAEGVVTYDDGSAVAGAVVVVGSTMFDQVRSATADAAGRYRVGDLPVGPLTFSARDASGNVAYAAAEIATAGQLLTRNISIYRRPFPGTGRVHGVVRLNDEQNTPVAGARVGVSSQGYGLFESYTDATGSFDFQGVPAGFVTLLAAEWSVSRQAATKDFDLRADEVREENLVLFAAPREEAATLTGEVWREKVAQPGVYERVSGALVKIDGYRLATADGDGSFAYENVPLSFSGRGISAWDPATQKIKSTVLPTLQASGANHVAIFISASDRGEGMVRVRLLSSAGQPVSGYRVLVPGFPPDVLTEAEPGIYELAAVRVGSSVRVFAVPPSLRPSGGPDPRPFGDQFAFGDATVSFNGQVAALTLRLPGEGTVRVKVRSQSDLITPVNLTYPVWWEGEQNTSLETVTLSTAQNGEPGQAVFTKVPALWQYTVSSAHSQYGAASLRGTLAYQGDLADHTLQLNTLAAVRGTVYAIDGVTPVPGVSVRIDNGRSNPGVTVTGPAGTFEFTDQPASTRVTITAEVTQNGVYRIGRGFALTPASGGAVDNLPVVLRRRGFVEGRVVYRDYRVYDPANASRNVPDDTPGDLTDNAPVPLASLYVRELDFPNRSFGTEAGPLTADAGGRFSLPHVFVGPIRARAWDPSNQELRGDWAGSVEDEAAGATPDAIIAIGSGGVGSARITVVDPNDSYAPVPNAEVTLFASGGRAFDFASADSGGETRFASLPVGIYRASAYSKSVGAASQVETLTIVRDETASARLTLEFSGRVQGTVTDPEAEDQDKRLVAGSHVRLDAAAYQTQATTDANGAFLFEGVREGPFTLTARDTSSNRKASATRTLSVLDWDLTVPLELERTATIYFAAYLPDDTGANSGILAPAMSAEAIQRCWTDIGGHRHCEYERQFQGNPLQFSGAFLQSPYQIGVFEPGRTAPSFVFNASFPQGSKEQPLVWVQPAFGSVRVNVTQAGLPASGAKVQVTAGRTLVAAYTDAQGLAQLSGVPLSVPAWVQVTSLDGRFTGTAATRVERQSVPAQVTVALGSYAGVTGLVEAETGGPSVGTRVVASFGSLVSEVRTDHEGRYTILGIPTSAGGSATVTLVFIGPDDTTTGGALTRGVTASEGIITVPTVRLDATPPVLEAITPDDGASAVSPDSSIVVVFSEPIHPSTINSSSFRLLAADGSGDVACALRSGPLSNGRFAVTLTPPKPSTGFPLRSNTLYRVLVAGSVTDLTGHRISGDRGFTFTTSDYAEPRVQKVLPASPIPRATAFEFRFNEAIDPDPWKAGGSASLHVYKLASPGGTAAAVVAELTATAFVDPVTGMSLFITPGDANPIEPESFYRVVFRGVRDLQGNALGEQTYEFFSYDEVAPHASIVVPAETEELITGSEYTLSPEFRNGSASGSPATDIAKVRYFSIPPSGQPTQFALLTSAPWTTKIVAPEAPADGLTYSLGIRAADASGNEGPMTTRTWTVRPNVAPKNVSVAPLSASAYPTRPVGASVTFTDEGTYASISVTFRAPKRDGSFESKTITRSITRVAGDTWPAASFDWTVPATAQPGGQIAVSATVTDGRGLTSAVATAAIEIATDLTQPVIVSVTPAPGTEYLNTQKYVIEAVVRDDETSVETVAFSLDGAPVPVASVSAGPQAGSQKFRSAQIETRAKAEDAAIPIVVTAKDYAGNARAMTFDVLYKGVNDPEAPKVAWACPIDGGAIPAGVHAFPLKLKARVVDQDIRAVKFVIGTDPAVTLDAVPVSATEYQAVHSFDTPATGPLALTVVAEDTVAEHRVELPISIDVIPVDFVLTDPRGVTAGEAASFRGKSVALIGTAAVFAPQAPLELANLLVLNGARVETLGATVTREFKADLTTTGVTYIDCDSRVDVTGKGYAGGWQNTADGRNDDSRGRTVGNVPRTSFAPYGSLFEPGELGSGGNGTAACCAAGAPGGGAIRLRGDDAGEGSRIVIAGSLLADGASGVSAWDPGMGGSVRVEGDTILLGPQARVSANGGDDQWVGNGTGAARGGRIAVVASTRLQLGEAVIEARGGRHFGPADTDALAGDADPGTIYVRRPGQEEGELAVSAFDGRFPSTAHYANRTLLGRVGTGQAASLTSHALVDPSRTFDRWMIGEALLVDGETSRSFRITGVSSDGHTLETDPRDGSLLDVALSQTATYAGLLRFDKVTLGPRTLAVFDDHLSVAGAIGSRESIAAAPGAVALLPGDVPALSVTTVPPDGGNVIRDSVLVGSVDASSLAGIASVVFDWSPQPGVRTESFSNGPKEIVSHVFGLPVPAATVPGAASLVVTATDRGGRSQRATRQYSVIENLAPEIVALATEPSSLYAGHELVVTATARDDVALRSLAFEVRTAAGSIGRSSFTPAPDAAEATRSFRLVIPPDTPGGSIVTVEVSAGDGFPGRAATVTTREVTVLVDSTPPTVSVTSPLGGAFRESVDVVPVRVRSVDDGTGVREVFAQFEGMSPVALVRVPGTDEWRADIAAPTVDGSAAVTRQLTIRARDYAGNEATAPPVSLTIQPVIDPNAPVIRTACTSSGAMFPPGSAVKVKVSVSPANAQNPVQSVRMLLGDTDLPVVSPAAQNYEATVSIPAGAPDGEEYRIHVVAQSAGGAVADEVIRFSVAVPDVTFSTNTTIDPANAAFDGKTMLVNAGVLTVRGPHAFDRLMVLGSGIVTAPHSEQLVLTISRGSYVGCGASITMGHRGYPSNVSYPGARQPYTWVGGSHIGAATWATQTTYGSVYRPMEPGSGAYQGTWGGGAIRVDSGTLTIDGAIYANGEDSSGRAGAGGSIWITAETIRGGGVIDARGGTAYWEAGGGGAIAVEYVDDASTLPAMVSRGGVSTRYHTGGAGTQYVKGPHSVYGDLVVDNAGLTADRTELPSLGNGAILSVSGASLLTDRAAPIPPYFAGHWLEVSAPDGTLKGRWRLADVDDRWITLEVDPAAVPLIAAGDRWQGVYAFDSLTVRSGTLGSADPIRSEVVLKGPVRADALNVDALTMSPGSVLRPWAGWIALDVTREVTIASGASIDAVGAGYPNNASYPGAQPPHAWVGGSHIGVGGFATGSTFGSVYRPVEMGGGAYQGTAGGGVVSIQADEVEIDGSISVNGAPSDGRSGAGGSVWITSGRVSGSGSILARGGDAHWEAGGGGAVSIEYEDASGGLPLISTRGGLSAVYQTGGAGSLYLLGPEATYGDLVVDNEGHNADRTELPSLGSGTALPGSGGATLVTDRTTALPAYFAGHWIEIHALDGTLRGIWRVASVADRTLTLEANESQQPTVQVGDTWQGVYLFDDVTVRSARLYSADPLRAGSETIQGRSSADTIHAPDVTIAGGSHVGRGGKRGVPGVRSRSDFSRVGGTRRAALGTAFGSVVRPVEPGGSAAMHASGGGAVRIRKGR